MAVAEEVGLEDPRSDAGDCGPWAPSPGKNVEKDSGRQAEEKNRAQASAGQILPGGSHQVSHQAEQGVKGGVAVGLLASEGPEVGQDAAIEEQLGPGVDLIGPRRRCSDLLDQLQGGRGLPAGGEPGGIAKSPKPLP